jgi:flagellar biosynthetic protein FliO
MVEQKSAEGFEYPLSAAESSISNSSSGARLSDWEAPLSITKLSGSILFVLALVLALAVFVKRYLPGCFGAAGRRTIIQIVETVSLGEKRSLILVRIEHENLLLASTPTSVSLIKAIGLDDTVTTASGAVLSKELAGPLANRTPPAETGAPVTFREVLTSELQESKDSAENLKALFRPSGIPTETETKLGGV